MEHHGDRTTLCISSQAGCAFACAFCSTGQAGFNRNLSAGEIFDQAWFFARELAAREKRITNIVFMGMGEPFHNYDSVMEAVALLNDPQGFGLGHRHITISTVGLVDKIDRFADEHVQVNLAISLHAPTDELRSRMMPVNRRFPIPRADGRVRAVRREDEPQSVLRVRHARGRQRRRRERPRAHRANAGPSLSRQSHPVQQHARRAVRRDVGTRIWEFAAILDAAGVPVTVRQNMGRDIAAACGQLRAETQPKAHMN